MKFKKIYSNKSMLSNGGNLENETKWSKSK